jgi:hypothetical protein
MTQEQVRDDQSTASAWESLTPTSFKDTLYLPSLKISVTAGSFIRYSASDDDTASKVVGRIVEVVASKDLVDDHEGHPLINLPIPDDVGSDVPVQFAKVNIFKDRQLLCDSKFPVDAADDDQRFRGCQKVVQLERCEWIPSYVIDGLAFVAMEHDAIILHDDCHGMRDFFIAKYRITVNGNVCVIPRHACPSFPGQIEGFRKLWSVDSCELIFKSMLQIRLEMQRILCRVAQSQGDFAVKNTKLLLPNCCWFFIKRFMKTKGVNCISDVRYSQPRAALSWGLVYHSRPYTGTLDVLRFDTVKKLRAFRSLFGTMSGYGVRKKRPKYSDGRSHLCLNDVLNVIVCRDSATAEEKDDDIRTTNSSSSDADSCSSHDRFQRFGVTDDGIDLTYDSSDGCLQIVLRYRKVVVTDESLPSLVGAGVLKPKQSALLLRAQPQPQMVSCTNIVSGMEFIDGSHVMRVQEVCSSEIRAKTIYWIDESTARTTKVTVSEIRIYNDIAYVDRKIQQMLE